MTQIKKISKKTRAIHLNTGQVYTVSMHDQFGEPDSVQSFSSHLTGWETAPQIVNGAKIVPYGHNNDLPDVIRRIMENNNIGPGIIERKNGLLYGDGPQQYQITYDGADVKREYVNDPEISEWLKSWDFKRYVDMAIVEYNHMKGVFVRNYRNRAPRIGRAGKIAQLKVVPATDARLGWPENGELRLENVKKIYCGDFNNFISTPRLKPYPVMDYANPLKYAVSMSYHNSYSFAHRFYSIPSFYGTLNWLQRSSEIPDILKYLTENGISAAWHIHSPQAYWEAKKTKLEDRHPELTDEEIDKKLDQLKDELFESISNALSGSKNAGKFIETVDFTDPDSGQTLSWKIEPIDQKIKDFIEAQVKVGDKADSAATSGMTLHPSLANLIVPNSTFSGSTMLYALKLYLASDTSIPEEVIFEPVNRAIAINWPHKNIQIGFYRRIVMKEENITSADRVASNT